MSEFFKVYRIKDKKFMGEFKARKDAVYFCKVEQTLPLPDYEWEDEFEIVTEKRCDHLYGNFDAQVWAEQFCQITEKNYGVKIDKDFMVGWFANAIMTGYDEANKARRVETSLQN